MLLESAVAALLGRDVDGLDHVQRTAIVYDAFLAHRTVVRVSGVARVAAKRVPWSLIEKATAGPGLAEPYLYANAVRESEAYASGILVGLAPAVRAPRLLGSTVRDDGSIVLWLEDVQHSGPRPLDAAALVAAARDLGTLAGHWHRRVPDDPWLFRGWVDRHSQPGAIPAGLAVLGRRSGKAFARLGDRLAAGRAVATAQPRVRELLEMSPQTLCHHDAVGANVFLTPRGTTLIDWESAGPGVIGADLASLLIASVRRGDAMASVMVSAFDDAVAAYTRSVRAQAPTIAARDVLHGLDAAIALRWKLIADVADTIERGRPARRGSLPDEPPRRALDELIALSDVVLAAAGRALAP